MSEKKRLEKKQIEKGLIWKAKEKNKMFTSLKKDILLQKWDVVENKNSIMPHSCEKKANLNDHIWEIPI